MKSTLFLISRRCVLCASVLALVFTVSSVEAKPYWFEKYQRAVEMIDEGQAGEAATLLNQVIKEHPKPIAALRVPGNRFIDYLPHYQQARAQVKIGDLRAAAESLSRAESLGALTASTRHADEHSKLRRTIDPSSAN